MRVAFISRATLFTGKGGDTVQMLMTAEYLRKLGVQVDIFPWPARPQYGEYDVLHAFNVIRPIEVLAHFSRFRGVKVISTIFVDYSEYETKGRTGFARFLMRAASPDLREYLKMAARWMFSRETNFSLSYLLLGHRRSVLRVLRKADMLLPNSHSEMRRLKKRYAVSTPYRVIPNAIDPALFRRDLPQVEKNPRLVLSVGRIEGVKNQLNLVKALSGTEYELIIIGSPAPNHRAYFEACQRAAGKNVTFLTSLSQPQLLDYYQRACVHALPSWFETTGLSSLEAGALGCNLVITDRGDTREYFGDLAFYCDPDDPASIYEAVKAAVQAPPVTALREKIYERYIWSKTAELTLAAYQEAAGNNG